MDRPTRSHPTLFPLTTLPPSPSYLHPPSIPPTPSLLSRPSSQTRLRPSRSVPTAIISTSASTPTLAPIQNKTTKKNNPAKKRTTRTSDHLDTLDREDWLTRTASALTLTRLEEKGQAWLAKRSSSTSLTGVEDEGWERGESGIGTLRRGQSRGQSRRGSTSTGGGWGDGTRDDPEEIEEEIVPDFVNAEEEEEEEEEGEEDVDEGEMKRVVLGRVGGWIDWAVGWMDFRGEEDEDEEEEDDRGASENGGAAMDGIDGGDIVKGELDPIELQKRLRRKKKWDAEAEVGGEGKMDVSSAPEQAGWWTDARWLVGVASKVAL